MKKKLPFIGGTPPVDKMAVKYKLVSISPKVFYTLSAFAGFGIVTAIGFLFFNIYCSDKR